MNQVEEIRFLIQRNCLHCRTFQVEGSEGWCKTSMTFRIAKNPVRNKVLQNDNRPDMTLLFFMTLWEMILVILPLLSRSSLKVLSAESLISRFSQRPSAQFEIRLRYLSMNLRACAKGSSGGKIALDAVDWRASGTSILAAQV